MKLWFVFSMFLGVAALAATPEELAAGRKIYTGKCARCHKLYEPMKYDDATWELWMTKMRDKSKLNDRQYRQLSSYVTTLRTPKP